VIRRCVQDALYALGWALLGAAVLYCLLGTEPWRPIL
jgi:hypothetical protein